MFEALFMVLMVVFAVGLVAVIPITLLVLVRKIHRQQERPTTWGCLPTCSCSG